MRTLIFIPTYNEGSNVRSLYDRLKVSAPGTPILWLDDASPDGTGATLDELAKTDPLVRVIHRPAKQGIGSAHLDAIRWAYEHRFDALITMDADLTHRPEDIPAFLEATRDGAADVVVGSRFMRAKSLPGWSPLRCAMTWLAHFLTRCFLGLPQDASNAFRLYRLDHISPDVFELVGNAGYGFFFESLYMLSANGFAICQIPVVLPVRTSDRSKMTVTEAGRGFMQLVGLGLNRLTGRRNFQTPSPRRAEGES